MLIMSFSEIRNRYVKIPWQTLCQFWKGEGESIPESVKHIYKIAVIS